VLTAAALLTAAAPAAAQPPVPGPPALLDSGTLARPTGLGLSIARDGTGGLVYLKAVGGVDHVFVSQLSGGVFQPPVQLDGGLGGASSQPVIAAGNGGVLVVAFVNGGQLYVAQGNPAGGFGPPTALVPGGFNPALSMSSFGKAYLAFTVPDGGGDDVRTAYYYDGQWALEGPALNASPADDAGTGTGRPAVVAAGDGIAIVAWGENGHIYTRRVWGTSPSVVYEQADAPPAGCTEASAGDPVVGAGGDSSYAPVAFQAQLTCAGQQQSRVLVNRLQGSRYDGVSEVDGLGGDQADGAEDPQIAMAEYGQGWVTSQRTVSGDVFAAPLGADGALAGGAQQVNGLAASPQPQAAYPTPAISGLYSSLIAWQQEPGTSGIGEIRVRYALGQGPLGPETVLSSPGQGPTDAADGLAADGDASNEAAVAWIQGTPGALQLMVAQMYEPPGGFSPLSAFQYTRQPQPVLAWSRPAGWGPITYSVAIDGTIVAQTRATSIQPPAPLADGPHTWQVTATNPVGQQSRTAPATVFVDSTPPVGTLRVVGRRLVGLPLHVRVSYADRPPAGAPGYDASGVATLLIRWGDGTLTHFARGTRLLTHVYRRPGRYQITLVITDRAGNRTQVSEVVRILRPKRPRRRRVRRRG